MNIFDSIVIGAASAALGTVVVLRFLNFGNEGGGQPQQGDLHSYTARGNRIRPETPSRLSSNSAPLVQNTPITEAAYNLQSTNYATTLGPQENVSSNPLTLPM